MIDFAALTFVDYAVILVLITSAIFSILRGMTREFLGLIGWVVSVVVAHFARPVLEDPIADVINAEGLSGALAWGLPFAATVIVWFLLASLLSTGLTRTGLGSLDRWFGFIFGLVRGYLLVLFAFIVAVLLLEGESKLPETLQKAQSTPIMSQSARYFAQYAPDDYADKLISNLSDHNSLGAEAAKTMSNMMNGGTKMIRKPLELLDDEKPN
jgi:membrane protein required for colicin V production